MDCIVSNGKTPLHIRSACAHRDTPCNLMNATSQTCSRNCICVCNHVSILAFYSDLEIVHIPPVYWGSQSSNQKIRHIYASTWLRANVAPCTSRITYEYTEQPRFRISRIYMYMIVCMCVCMFCFPILYISIVVSSFVTICIYIYWTSCMRVYTHTHKRSLFYLPS